MLPILMLTSRSTLNAQCASLPADLTVCLDAPSSYSVIGNPAMETNISDWISNGCILSYTLSLTTAQQIVVIGDIRFDVDYNFAPGTDIVVDSLKRFVQTAGIVVGVFGTTIRGCENMWREWKVESSISSSALLQVKDSEIFDAVHGFRLQPESVFGAQNNEFTNNRISIRTDFWGCDNLGAPSLTPLADYWSIGGICDNIFTAPSLKPPFNGQTGYSGILVQAMNLIDIGIGSGCFSNNEFSDYFYGVNACNVVNMDLQNSIFHDIGSATSTSGETCVFFATPNGVSDPSLLNQEGIGPSFPSIENSTNGILVYNGDAVIRDNLVSNVFDGIMWVNNLNRNSQIIDNTIDNYEGFAVSGQNSIPMDLTVEDNLIINSDNLLNIGLFDVGIHLSGSSVTNNAFNMHVRENTLINQKTSASQPYFGINSSNNDFGLYGNNEIEDQSSGLSSFAGIRHFGDTRGRVGYNSIVSTTTQPASIPGMYGGLVVSTSPRMRVFCNFTDGTTDGLQFYENCDQSVIQNNEMNNHDSGLLYSSPFTITDIQDNEGNRWPFMTSTVEANWPAADFSFLPLSEYYVFSSISDQWPNPVNPSNWFFVQGDPGLPCIQGIPGGGGGERSSEWDNEWIPRLSAANVALLEGTLDVPQGQDGRLFDYQAEVFRLLHDYPQLINDHPEALDYYDAMYPTIAGRLVIVESGLEEAFLPSEGDKLSLQNLSATLSSGQIELRELQATLVPGMTTEERNQVLAQLRILSASIQNTITEIRDLRLAILSIQDDAAESLISELNGLVPETDTEEDLKTALLLKITDKMNKSNLEWSANDKTTLETIAAKCPFEAGRAVYYARNLLSKDKTWQIVSDDPLCGAVEEISEETSSTISPESGTWTIYPSPTSESIWLKNGHYTSAEFKLYNSQGIAVAEGEVQPARPIIVSHLPDGFYWITVRDKVTLSNQTLPIQILR
jgi:hypothetical protein